MMKRAIGGALVVGCALATGLGARGFAKQAPERAQPFRQKGAQGARVTIVEFSDFECPACRVAEPPLRQIMQLYGPDVRLIFKHFPLERIHEYARLGAVSAECAGRQGKFWELHDLLYDRQDAWTNVKSKDEAKSKVDGFAKQAGVDLAALEACRADPSVQKAIDADVQEAHDRWVGGTPTFFINGKRFVAARQLQERGSRWIAKVLGK